MSDSDDSYRVIAFKSDAELTNSSPLRLTIDKVGRKLQYKDHIKFQLRKMIAWVVFNLVLMATSILLMIKITKDYESEC